MKYVYLFLLLIITLPAMANNKVSGEDIVQKATQYSGIRYTPGGSNPKRGFDCSGFGPMSSGNWTSPFPAPRPAFSVRTNKFQTTRTYTWATWYFSAEAAYPTRSVTWESSYQSTTKPENFHSFTLHARE